jgi:hypothetical protein
VNADGAHPVLCREHPRAIYHRRRASCWFRIVVAEDHHPERSHGPRGGACAADACRAPQLEGWRRVHEVGGERAGTWSCGTLAWRPDAGRRGYYPPVEMLGEWRPVPQCVAHPTSVTPRRALPRSDADSSASTGEKCCSSGVRADTPKRTAPESSSALWQRCRPPGLTSASEHHPHEMRQDLVVLRSMAASRPTEGAARFRGPTSRSNAGRTNSRRSQEMTPGCARKG